MRKLYAYFQLAGLVLLTCCGCKLSEADKDVVVKIDSEFLLGMQEELHQTRDFKLTFKTIENQSCQSNTISFTADHNNRNLKLNLIEILETKDCQSGEGQVEGRASFDFLPIGTYNLELILKNTIQSTGTLKVSNEKFDLGIEDGFGFQAVQSTLMRVPSFMIWGYVAYKDSQHVGDADDFLNELSIKTTNLKLGKGDYGYFQIGDNETLSLDKTPDYNNFKTFYRAVPGSLSDLVTLLQSFRNHYPTSQMEFKIFTWEGETL